MKKYNVYGSVSGTKYLGQIEAESMEQATKIAWDGRRIALSVDLCHQCARECENAEITDIEVEEEE